MTTSWACGKSRSTSTRSPLKKAISWFLYTDGIVEAKNANNEDYTVSRLNRLVSSTAERASRRSCASASTTTRAFREKDTDDITFIALQKKA